MSLSADPNQPDSVGLAEPEQDAAGWPPNSEGETDALPLEAAEAEALEDDPLEGEPLADAQAFADLNTSARLASIRRERQAEAEQDRVLVEQARAGDGAAFRSLVQRHQRRAFGIAFALVHHEEDAQEVVQEAFVRVYRNLPAFNGSSSFFTWLYRIVTNLSIDLLRKPSRRETGLEDAPAFDEGADARADFSLLARLGMASPADVVRRKELAACIEDALATLPPYHRGVIVMREIEGLSYEEMAEAMGVSKGTIMSRLFHARKKLQAALAQVYREQIGREPPREAES
jgi:RNA polymerase sigma-70 factor (ECF subfamily)